MPRDLTTIEKGTQAEAIIMAHLAAAGYAVLIPFGVARYDLAIDPQDGTGIKTVQCKLGRLRNGTVRWKSSSSVSRFSGSNPGYKSIHYRGIVDYFGVWCPDTDKTYLVPPEDAGLTMGQLRIVAPRNNQTKHVRWGWDYELRSIR